MFPRLELWRVLWHPFFWQNCLQPSLTLEFSRVKMDEVFDNPFNLHKCCHSWPGVDCLTVFLSVWGSFCNISQLVRCGAVRRPLCHIFLALSRWRRRRRPFAFFFSSRGGNKKWNLFKRIKNWKSHKHAFATSLGTGTGTVWLRSRGPKFALGFATV